MGVWYTTAMSEKYTLQLSEVGDHLQVHILELDITVETAPGKTSYDDAYDVAQQAIIRYHMARQEREQVRAS
jgi:hypothetical protein